MDADAERDQRIADLQVGEAVYVGLSRALSGTLQSAESAAARIGRGRVCVIDSGHASCGQALIALAIAEAAESGLDAAALASLALSLRARTQTWAIARDIAFGVRGGRVPRWAGSRGFAATRRPCSAGCSWCSGSMAGRRRSTG